MNLENTVLEYLSKKEKSFAMPVNKYKYGRRGITVREATEVLGTTELRKIMSDMKEKGYKVVTVWEEGLNRYGNMVRYKRYFVETKKTKMEKDAILAGFIM